MKKRYFISIVTVLFFSSAFVIAYSKFKEGGNFRAWASSKLCYINSESELPLKRVKLIFTDKQQRHFDKLYKGYVPPHGGEEFISNYPTLNRWQKCQIFIDDDKYEVKIKSHGTHPSIHKYGEHFSLSVKFNSSNNPFNQKRVNMIIYNRVQQRMEILSLISKRFGLVSQQSEAVIASVGNNRDYIYFIEDRLNNKYLKRLGSSLILPESSFPELSKPKHKYRSYVDGYENKVFMHSLIDSVFNLPNDLPDSINKLRIKAYHGICDAIADSNSANLTKYLDTENWAKISALRILFGESGHGFLRQNLTIGYNPKTNKLESIVHRDYFSKVQISNSDYPMQEVDAFLKTKDLLLLTLVNENPEIKRLTAIKLQEFVTNYPWEEMSLTLDSINNKYQNLFRFKFSISDGEQIKINMKNNYSYFSSVTN